MHRLFKSLLVVLLLAGQFHLVVHAYEEHNDEQICDVCITLKQQDHALDNPLAAAFAFMGDSEITHENIQFNPPRHVAYFSVRAPPYFL